MAILKLIIWAFAIILILSVLLFTTGKILSMQGYDEFCIDSGYEYDGEDSCIREVDGEEIKRKIKRCEGKVRFIDSWRDIC